MQLTDKKVAAKVVLDRSDHFHCLATKRVKRVCDNRVKTQTPGIMTLLPMAAAAQCAKLPGSGLMAVSASCRAS